MYYMNSCEVPEQAKLVYGEKNRSSGCLWDLWEGCADWEEAQGNLLGGWKCLYLSRNLDYVDICICQNSSNGTFKTIHFTTYKFYLKN